MLLSGGASSDSRFSARSSWVQAANTLSDAPEFSNTITSNFTTIVYRMARQTDPGLGGAPGRSVPIEQLRQRGRIADRAGNAAPGDDFSKAIRAGVH
ncbi:hypothetical protein ACFPME_04745 [Rhodanobacter umsongensis]|uniref:Uncharacterized protein n=1 Tax=Rhodanobacter umsongensis TaxID=633153 RepID=A0ABW0JIT0_9GAMM